MSETKKGPTAEEQTKAPLTAVEAVKLFAAQKISVTVVKRANGKPVRDPSTKRYVTEAVPLAAAHIIGINERDGEVGITTADGNKYVAAK